MVHKVARWRRLFGSDDGSTGESSAAGGATSAVVTGAVPGRAVVAPASTRQYGQTFDDGTNIGSFSPEEKRWVETTLALTSASDGERVPNAAQGLRLALPAWVVTILYAAGTNDTIAAELPPSIDVPVLYDPMSLEIVQVDVDAVCAELRPFRDVAVRHFRRTDSWLAPLRNAIALPGDAIGAGAGVIGAWKAAITDPANATTTPTDSASSCSWTDAEIESMRRNAAILAIRWQNRPKERDRARAAARKALPMHAQNVRNGSLAMADFEVILMREEVSTAITAEEAAAYRAATTGT